MQRHMGNIQDELRQTQKQLYEAEEERDRAVDELREMKKVAQEANMRLSEALSSKRSGELYTELSAAKKSLSDATRELQLKEKGMESLRLELEKVQLVELKLAERDAAVDKLKKELNIAKITESHTVDSLSESKARIQELERELEKKKNSEAQVFDSLVSQTKQLEQTKILLEESKLEIASLHDRVQIFEGSYGQSSRDLDIFNNCLENNHSRKEELESLKSDLHQAKGNLAHAQEAEHLASSQTQAVLQEMGLLKSELKLALEAEEKSKKAMDDLALALTEVATEANQAKEKLSSTQAELANKKEEAEQLKQTLKSTESKYQILLDETRKEMECYRNISERLRSEAEESLLAWNLKETEFVNCMKEAEEEKIAIQQENTRMTESMKAAEDMKKASREENHKLRDILRQALNESNVAKEAAGIARAENSQLKDCLTEKDDALDFFTRENERLRVSEAAANENIKELKYLLSTVSAKEVKTEEKEVAEVKTHKPTAKVKTEDKEVAEVKTHKPNAKVKPEDKEVAEVKTHKPTAKVKAEDKEVAEVKAQKPPLKEHHDGKKARNTFSFDLEELKIPVKPKDEDEDFLIEEALKGSIFDTKSPPMPVHHHRKMSSSIFTDDGETICSEDFDNLEGQHFDEAEHERSSHRKKKALLRRFGDLIRRRSFHQKAGMNEPNAQ